MIDPIQALNVAIATFAVVFAAVYLTGMHFFVGEEEATSQKGVYIEKLM